MSISQMVSMVRGLVADQKGVTAIEYAVLAALIIVAAVGAIQGVSTALNGTLANIAGAL